MLRLGTGRDPKARTDLTYRLVYWLTSADPFQSETPSSGFNDAQFKALHKAKMERWADPDRQLRSLGAGCLYVSDDYPNCCQVVEVELDGNGRPLEYHVWARGWSEDGFWVDETKLYRAGARWTDVVNSPLRTPLVPRAFLSYRTNRAGEVALSSKH